MTAVFRVTQVSLALLALALSSAIALAQSEGSLQEVEITAFTTVIPANRSAAWRQVELVQRSNDVSYADLDLTTEAGARELRQRIRHTAKAVCQELHREYPFANDADLPAGSCVDEAVHFAMLEAHAAIAAAHRAKTHAGKAPEH